MIHAIWLYLPRFMSTPFERATLPKQYDLDDLAWSNEGRFESTRTQFYWEYLEPYSLEWREKRVLDIGSGTGWLVECALKSGASEAVGIEPSENNLKQGRKDHPDIKIEHVTFEAYDAKHKKFDVILAVMSFPHLADLESTFKKMAEMLDANGQAIVVVPDYEFIQSKRHSYPVDVERIDDESYAVAFKRPTGTLADIVRKTEAYQRAAESAGLEMIEDKPMKPTEKQMAKAPKYIAFKDMALSRLLVFRGKLG